MISTERIKKAYMFAIILGEISNTEPHTVETADNGKRKQKNNAESHTVETADNGKRKQKRLTVTRPGSTAVKGERCAV